MDNFKGRPEQVERTKTQIDISRTSLQQAGAFLDRPTTPPVIRVDNSDGIDVDEDQLSTTSSVDLSSSSTNSIVNKVNFVTSTPCKKYKDEKASVDNFENVIINEMLFDEDEDEAVKDELNKEENGGAIVDSIESLDPPSEPIETRSYTQFGTGTFNMDSMLAEEDSEMNYESPATKSFALSCKFIFYILVLIMGLGLVDIYGKIFLLENNSHNHNYPIAKRETTAIVPYVFAWAAILHLLGSVAKCVYYIFRAVFMPFY